ncbi:MAG: hypothetical protein K2Q06_04020, partial [Parvularculaceae bacterium]|nr:hypothetical protein [Parvularculaceae bacterium]
MSLEFRDAPAADGMPADALDAMRLKVDARLADLFKETPQDTRLVCAIRHGLLSPGKRFRPIITLLSHVQCGGAVDD